jgi:hypothetical protein
MSPERAQPELPPQVALYHLATGHYLSHALCLAAKLRIADLLKDGPRHSKNLAEATGLHAPSLNRVMRLLASVGVFEEQANGSFELTSLGEYLRADAPGSARAMVMLFAGERIQDAWRELEYCLRTGDPVFRKRGLDDPFTDPTRSPDENANFDAAMADITKLTAIAVAAAYDFGPFRTVVDVGGRNGAMLIGILNANRICVGLSSTSRMPRSAHRNRSPRVRYRSGVKPSGETSSRKCPAEPTRTSSSTSSTIGMTTAPSQFSRAVIAR